MSEHLYLINPSPASKEVVEDLLSDYGGHAMSEPVNRGMADDELLDIMHEFTRSQEFRNRYTTIDRQLAIRAFMACEQGAAWKYSYCWDEEGVLFGANIPGVAKPANLVDGLVMSGALGWSNDAYRDLVDYSDEKNISLLDTYRWAGAASLSLKTSVFERGSYERTVNGVTTTQYVGADMHGDFRTRRIAAADSTVIAPGGEQVGFAPLIFHQEAQAYHSTEMNIAAGMLAKLFQDKTPQETATLKQQLLDTTLNRSGSIPPFGDFGDEAGRIEQFAALQARTLQVGDVITSVIVSPDTQRLSLNLISGEGGVIFRVVERSVDNESKIISQLEIPESEICDFIAAMGAAGQGRVSTDSIRELIAIF